MANSYVRCIDYSIYKLDENLKIIEVDENFEIITGYSKKDIKKNSIYQGDLIPEEDREEYFKKVYNNLNTSGEAYIEHRIRRKDNKDIFVFCLGCNNIDEKTGKTTATIRITRMDKTLSLFLQRKNMRANYSKKIEHYKKEANTDNLTSLLRRDPFINEVRKHLDNKTNLALLIIDIDDFKNINDTYGHNIGDEVLVKVSESLKTMVSDKGITCRLGGDEFTIVLIDINDIDIIKDIAERILTSIKNIKLKIDPSFSVSVSIGIHYIKDYKNISFESLYNLADDALYKAKEKGKDRYFISQ